MNLLFHIIINGLFALSLKLNTIEIIVVILGGVLIDIDHIIYQYFVIKNRTLNQMGMWHAKENKIKSHHHFPFHFLEIGILLSFVFYFINWFLFLFFVGFALHILTDLVEHLIFHKSLSPFRYYTLIGYFINP